MIQDIKSKLLSALNMLSELESNPWKSRAYRNAYFVFMKVPEQDIQSKLNFTYLQHVGNGISGKVIELRTTGKIAKLEELLKSSNMIKENNEYKVRKGYVSRRIPLSKAKSILDKLGIKESKDLIIGGSYRRKVPKVADLDLLCFTEDEYWRAVGLLSENPECTLLVSGSEKTSFRYNNPENTQIDINNTSHGNKWTQLLHHTGSKDSNIRLRAQAKKLGYMLNQYGLSGYKGKIESEEDIFTALGLPYISPEMRN